MVVLTSGQITEGRKEGRKEGRDVIFNDALNTFYLWLYGVRHMEKDFTEWMHIKKSTEPTITKFKKRRKYFYLTMH